MFQTPTAAGIPLAPTPTGYLGKSIRPRVAPRAALEAQTLALAACIAAARKDLAAAKAVRS